MVRLRSQRRLVASALPFCLIALAYWALTIQPPATTPQAPAAATASASDCQAALQKSVDRNVVFAGQDVLASLVVSATCGAKLGPIDLVFLADESFSMTRAKGAGQPADPTATPDPMGTSDPGSGQGDKPGDDPVWCKGATNVSSPTPTPWWPAPKPEETATPAEAAGEDDLLRDEQKWVRDFLDQEVIKRDMASDRLRVGLVSFADGGRVKVSLTKKGTDVLSAVNRMRGADLSFVGKAFRDVDRVFDGAGKRPDADRTKVLVILSDFQFCAKDVRQGASGKDRPLVVTVGFGRSANQRYARELATDPRLVLKPADLAEFIKLYQALIGRPKPISLVDMKVRDTLASDMRYLPDSANPPTMTVAGQTLEWVIDRLPMTLTYRVEPLALDAGPRPLSDRAEFLWTDSMGRPGLAPFPVPEVEVLALTPTPTATPTSTPSLTATPTSTATATTTLTPTPTPAPAWLPFTLSRWPEPPPPTAVPTVCVPGAQTIDIALVVDTSNSMSDPTQAGGQRKIDAAIDAALEIVNLLKGGDQAAVVSFHGQAELVAQLTADKAALGTAVRSLASRQAGGTRIDLGLAVGAAELASPRHLAANTRALLLVTDGDQSEGGPQAVLAAADAAKAAGVKVLTVGLGQDVNAAVLRAAASDPSLFFTAPKAEDLAQLYREVARLIPCP